MNAKNSTVVIGEGWAALGLVGFLTHAQKPVIWVGGSGARIDSPLPSLEVGESEAGELGAMAWKKLAEAFDIPVGELESGSFLREFRNKAFREPAWTKAPTPEDRKNVRDEMLWESEKVLAPVFEARFAPTLAEIEAALRAKLADQVRHIEGVPVQSLQIEAKSIVSVTLASGEVIPCDLVYFADRWAGISKIEGMPKAMPFTRKRGEIGVLQAVFTHDLPEAGALREGFFGPLHKEAGEEIERHVWGCFSSDGSKSYWTTCLSTEENEDNHAIGKKLRRMKSALEKMFAGTAWALKADGSNIKSEQVRFEEAVLFSEGEALSQPISASGISNLFFLTDGYGPANAMTQVIAALDPSQEPRPNTESKSTDVDNTGLA